MNLRDGHQPGGLALAVRRPNLTRSVAGPEQTPSKAVIGPMLSGGGSRPVQPITTGLVEPGSGGRRLKARRDAIGLGSAAGLPAAGLARGLILRADATADCPPVTGVEPSRTVLRMAVVVSVVVHLGVLLMMMPMTSRPVPLAPEAPQRQVEMVFIQQPRTTRGAPPKSSDAASASGAASAASTSPPLSTARVIAQPGAALDSPAGLTTPHWQTSMLDNLGDAPQDDAAYSDTSDDIRPTRPDSAYRNMPPRYPEDAARHGQHGVVDIIVHVRPDGRPGQVEITSSSGVTSLDHAAVEALSRWHFQPQMRGAVPVPSQFRIAVHYDGSGQ